MLLALGKSGQRPEQDAKGQEIGSTQDFYPCFAGAEVPE
jgi:hypothetical protein